MVVVIFYKKLTQHHFNFSNTIFLTDNHDILKLLSLKTTKEASVAATHDEVNESLLLRSKSKNCTILDTTSYKVPCSIDESKVGSSIGYAYGTKAYAALMIAKKAKLSGCDTLVTASSLKSPQGNRVASIAAYLGMKCIVVTNQRHSSTISYDKPSSLEFYRAKLKGAEIIPSGCTFNNATIKIAEKLAASSPKYFFVPFGLTVKESLDFTKRQVKKIKTVDFDSILVPVGSGWGLIGIISGLLEQQVNKNITGVCVSGLGLNLVLKNLAKYNFNYDITKSHSKNFLKITHPKAIDWECKLTLIKSKISYSTPAPKTDIEHFKKDNIYLDSIYEAKCIPQLKEMISKGEKVLFWIIGQRETEKLNLLIDNIKYEPLEAKSSPPKIFHKYKSKKRKYAIEDSNEASHPRPIKRSRRLKGLSPT